MKNYTKLVFFYILILCVSCSTEEINDEKIEEPTAIDKSGNRHTMGSWGPQILTDSKYKSMHIEIGYVEGYKPKEEAISKLKEFLQNRINKPKGIDISLKALPSSNKAPFDRLDWQSIEDEHREKYNSGDELAIWIYYADGGKDDGTGGTTTAHGTAYLNTSIFIYAKEISEWYSDTNVSVGLAEANIIGHEFGHLFGLVNGGITPVSDHVDPDDPIHCVTENCLMKSGKTYAYNQQDMFQLGDSCLEDLHSIGGK